MLGCSDGCAVLGLRMLGVGVTIVVRGIGGFA